MNKLFMLIISLLLLVCFAFADEVAPSSNITSYSEENGYVYVTYGSYPQFGADEKTRDPKKMAWKWASNHSAIETMFSPEPILWRVLKVDNNVAFLCSEYILFANPMHVNYGEYKSLGSDFSNTDLCDLLNNKFLNRAFTTNEQKSLLSESDSQVKVSLLTAANLNDTSIGFGTNKSRKAWSTQYAIQITKAFVYRVSKGQHSPYWVQDQSSKDQRHARCTKQEGNVGHIVADRYNEGVRPVIWINLAAVDITSGSGSQDDPFCLCYAGHPVQ